MSWLTAPWSQVFYWLSERVSGFWPHLCVRPFCVSHQWHHTVVCLWKWFGSARGRVRCIRWKQERSSRWKTLEHFLGFISLSLSVLSTEESFMNYLKALPSSSAAFLIFHVKYQTFISLHSPTGKHLFCEHECAVYVCVMCGVLWMSCRIRLRDWGFVKNVCLL